MADYALLKKETKIKTKGNNMKKYLTLILSLITLNLSASDYYFHVVKKTDAEKVMIELNDFIKEMNLKHPENPKMDIRILEINLDAAADGWASIKYEYYFLNS